MDLEEVRWKTAEELDPNEVTFLKENIGKLNEEERTAFKEVLRDPEEEVPVDAGAPEEDEAAGRNDEEEEEAGAATETKEPQFLTKEDAEDFVKKAIEDRDAAKKDAKTGTEEEQVIKKEILKFFDDDYKPKDPNELANAIVDKLTPLLVDQTVNKIGQLSSEQRQKFDDANKALDQQYNDLAEKNGLPALNTDEGQRVNAELATWAAKYGLDNYPAAYDLWSKVPKEYGGGLEVASAGEEKTEKKKAVNNQKKAAAMVGGGAGGEGSKGKGAPTRQDIQTLDMDTLLERAQA